jgi:hypothetical protein
MKMEVGKPHRYAVVTGASTGLGAAFARQLAKTGKSLVLVALPQEGLTQFAAQLEAEYGISTLVIEADLTLQEERKWVVLKLEEVRPGIDLLINNAGIGGSQAFETATSQWLSQIITLNIMHTALFIHALLPALKRVPKANILNVSSMAGLTPMPFKTVYPASKAFITSFSLGLDAELRESTNIRVFALHPGGMMTNADVSRRLKNQNWLGRKSVFEVDEIAKIGLRGIQRGNPIIIPGWSNRLNYLLFKWIPWSIRSGALVRFMKKELELP